MTKCHHIAILLTIILLSACSGNSGPSLSEYGEKSPAGRKMQFERYAQNLFLMPVEKALEMQDSTMRAASADSAAFRNALDLQEIFFFDANSPYRCEEYYLPVLNAIAESEFTSEDEKAEALRNKSQFSLNRLGTPAADFEFTLKNGRKLTLYSVDAEFILLFFSNPGCENCKEISQQLSASPDVLKMLADGRLAIVNIYPDDALESWLGYVSEYPKEWVSGYAPEIDEYSGEELPLYYLRAIPSLYLLDKDKNVILKDAPLERILLYLE